MRNTQKAIEETRTERTDPSKKILSTNSPMSAYRRMVATSSNTLSKTLSWVILTTIALSKGNGEYRSLPCLGESGSRPPCALNRWIWASPFSPTIPLALLASVLPSRSRQGRLLRASRMAALRCWFWDQSRVGAGGKGLTYPAPA